MSFSLQTVGRSVRAAPTRALAMGLTQTRRLSSTDNVSNKRDTAVHDPIMDKFWRAGAMSPAASVSTISTAAKAPVTSTSTSRDPPLGTFAFEPSLAPRWSESSNSSSRQGQH
ncbi:hypothetical protein FZEAL_5405 [Fusarium zealandicum]|uniref:Uncharacterized protein n=1 Tax=Fusarium zealandicum TaxID=1053134 RepID=A0A8H4UKI8_9HYPO|nr:hypothetical protein FZEAL_5405 [Fusarium zealandicum]